MTTSQEILTQEIINRMNGYCEAREKSAGYAAERSSRNQKVRDLIDELTGDES